MWCTKFLDFEHHCCIIILRIGLQQCGYSFNRANQHIDSINRIIVVISRDTMGESRLAYQEAALMTIWCFKDGLLNCIPPVIHHCFIMLYFLYICWENIRPLTFIPQKHQKYNHSTRTVGLILSPTAVLLSCQAAVFLLLDCPSTTEFCVSMFRWKRK